MTRVSWSFKRAAAVISVALAVLVGNTHAQQVPLPTNAAAVPGPAAGNKTTAYVQAVGRIAYIWGYAMVNSHNRRVAFSEAPRQSW